MFDSKQTLTDRLANATDLLIDFATLGEYGLEPVGRARQGCADSTPAAAQRPPRATNRSASCNLLSEAGFTRPARPTTRTSRHRHTVDGPFLLRP